MSSEKQEVTSIQNSEISKFYQGKSIFITGASGFVGTVLLEILLRCCPGIQRIYILLRSKKGVQPEDRKEKLFKKEIFWKLKENNTNAIEKVAVVPGDVSQDNLGMSKSDLLAVTQEVSVVFHCAASISFLKPLSFMIDQNVISTNYVIELCRKLTKFETLVYCSTAFSNCNRKEIDEIIYELPFKAEEVMELSRNGNEDGLNHLFSKCNPQFPNFYTFSKCVAENLIAEKACDLSVCIIRPSVITCCKKGVLPGYIEGNMAVASLSIGIGRGFIRVIYVNEEKKMEHISVDVAANVHIVAAYLQVSESLPSPFIYNCTSSQFTLGQLARALLHMSMKYPLPNAYRRPAVLICNSWMKYKFFSVLNHYAPALVIDFLLWITGRKLRLFKLYQFYDRCMKAIEPFMMNNWDFRCENFKALPEKLNTTDAEMFPVDMKDFNLDEIVECIPSASPFYRLNNKPYEKNSRVTSMRFFLASFIEWFLVGSIASATYMAIFKTW